MSQILRYVLTLNENLLDYRQTRREAVVLGSRLNSGFPQLRAPVEGRVINLSATVRF